MQKKTVQRVTMPTEEKLLVDRRNAAQYLSISQRTLEYLLAHGELLTRPMGAPVS